MKIALASDLHLEFGDINLKNEQSADVLILAGDICVAKDLGKQSEMGERVRDFFKRVAFQFPKVIYVMGNHEHYSGDYAKSADTIRANVPDNVHLLDRGLIMLDDWMFVGGTLWTDFNKQDPLTLHAAETMMNDYRGVKHTGEPGIWKFLPRHSFDEHMKTKNYIANVLSDRRQNGRSDRKVVVVGHHAPSFNSIDDQYRAQHIMNGCFYSNLDEFIMDHEEIAVWIHGHVHQGFDYKIGETRILCNPRGYTGYERIANTFELLYVDL